MVYNMKKSLKSLFMGIVLSAMMLGASACKSNEENFGDSLAATEVTAAPSTEQLPSPAVDASATVSPADDYDYSLVIDGSDSYDISDMLYGLFFEDINFAIDSGLYAEKVKNRSFEYGKLATNGAKCGWQSLNEVAFEVINGSYDGSSLNENNPQYARIINNNDHPDGIGNEGFLDGIAVEDGAGYHFSAFFKSSANYNGPVTISLRDSAGTIYGEAVIEGITGQWRKYEVDFNANASVSKGLRLYVLINAGTIDMDMVSLFPKDTYKGRPNGLRKDLATALEELSPKFIRFPGGCVIEGENLSNAYSWKDSIGNGMKFEINGKTTYGDVATRPLAENIWGNQNSVAVNPYYMTYGLGFFEYFQLCEDIGAAPVPILNAGLSCLFQGSPSAGTPRESRAIGTPEFDRYIQDALDLVEFCKGGADTEWGAIRIGMGHEAPFDLTYIGIGNEQWGEVYFSRYEAFQKAFEQAASDRPELYADIKLVVSNGPVATDSYAWKKIKSFGADYAGLVDEHYYQTPGWFLTNTNRYDSYDRTSTPVFLGEYAAKTNSMEAALAEAAYMTGLERNGDIVKLASYAPLFGNGTANQWKPDMLWFTNHSIWKSVNYYVQKIFSNNLSQEVYRSTLTGNNADVPMISGKVGVGTWMTSAVFDNIKVIDNVTGEVLYSDDFSEDTSDRLDKIAGNWSIKDGQLLQSYSGNPRNTITGNAAFLGDTSWTDYTLTLTATKQSGAEGFLIPFAVKDKDNYFHWNIGGWNNTVSCLEQISSGYKSGQIAETVKRVGVKTGKPYEIKIVVSGNQIECFLDGNKLIHYVVPEVPSIYQVSGLDKAGNLIVKIVNVSDQSKDILIQGNDLNLGSSAELSLLAADNISDINTLSAPDHVSIQNSTIDLTDDFIYTAPKYSVSVLRIPVTN